MLEETKLKISKTLKEKFNSQDWIDHMRKKVWTSGKKHPNWKGGITPVNIVMRKSLKYKLWRESVFKRDNWTCQICNNRGIKLNADHIKSFADYIDLRFELSNGRTLCVPCHRKTHNYGKDKTGFKFSEESKRKMSLSHKCPRPWRLGLKHTDATKLKISITKRQQHIVPTNAFKKGNIPWNKKTI